MASIEKIKASAGSGNANVATVQTLRAPLSSTIIVDTVLGINPAGFAGTMGTPHTFTDPITSEVITVISEATAVDFIGHIDSGHIIIDTIAPGYTDLGSAVADIIIVRPTTQYGDNLAAVLAASHNDNGSIHATRPQVVTSIDDTNGNELIKVTPTASAVNELTLANAATGNDPILSSSGGDTDVGITITPKGAGKLTLNNKYNPYKFSVYRSSGWTSSNALAKVQFNAELFDTNNNFDSTTNFRYTAPIDGFYQFDASIAVNTSNGGVNYNNTALYKNGSLIKLLGSNTTPAVNVTERTGGGCLLQLTAGDYVEVFFVNTLGVAGASGATETWFTGHFVSKY